MGCKLAVNATKKARVKKVLRTLKQCSEAFRMPSLSEPSNLMV
jgi:hypothetical protein